MDQRRTWISDDAVRRCALGGAQAALGGVVENMLHGSVFWYSTPLRGMNISAS
jgi:hypothetical protein